MINEQLNNIKKVLKTFDSKKERDGEPKDEIELYILKSLWVMLCAEFEGCLKDLIYDHINKIKNEKNLQKMHPILIMRDKWVDKKFTTDEFFFFVNDEVAGKDYEIKKENFVNKNETCYKPQTIEKVFNRLGIFFDKSDKNTVSNLYSIASTRDSIAHGDRNISITRKELEEHINQVEKIYKLLKNKLLYTSKLEKKPLKKILKKRCN
jgi:hypothetical protein